MIAELTDADTGEQVAKLLQWGRDQLIAELRASELVAKLSRTRLQWGRDQLIAELSICEWLWVPILALQWGRDQLIAELLTPPPHHRPNICFNGAAIN